MKTILSGQKNGHTFTLTSFFVGSIYSSVMRLFNLAEKYHCTTTLSTDVCIDKRSMIFQAEISQKMTDKIECCYGTNVYGVGVRPCQSPKISQGSRHVGGKGTPRHLTTKNSGQTRGWHCNHNDEQKSERMRQ